MAQTKERQASTLTLAAQKRGPEALILRALGPKPPANATASLPGGLAAPLAEELADCSDARNEKTMDTRILESRIGGSLISAPQAQGPRAAQLGRARAPRQPGPIGRKQRPFPEAPGSPRRTMAPSLGVPLCIEEAAELIGCSPWTVRQTLIPRGLPHFRFRANGRLVFYRDQVIRWIENQQGGITTS
jgi:hypothetical protein